ncbi:unnamed protein product, partial [Rotaria sp. Silwood2]
IIAESIQILIQDLENACESALTAMTKLSWQTIETVGDQSLYVTTIINHLKTIAPAIRNHLGLSRKYFIQFCTTFVDSFIKKFINHLYRCKPINIIGAEQVLLDTHSLKTVLLDLPSINLTVSRKPPQNFTKIILKNMTRAEMILKVVLTPNDFARQFVKSYLQLMNNDGDISSFQKILDMKGIRRPEQAHLIERLKREHATIIASHQQQIQQHYERVFSATDDVEQILLDLCIIHGDNVALIREIDAELNKNIDFSRIRADSLQVAKT